jgi:uncharacterized membrane protein YedE/YeeE
MPVPVATILPAVLGLLCGAAFGLIVQRTHFCTMGGIADAVLFGDTRRLRAWLLAMAVALAASQLLILAGAVDLATSVYRTHPVGVTGAVLGGGLFGFGMTQTGGCASRCLVRAGAGSLKALVVVLVMGLSAAITLALHNVAPASSAPLDASSGETVVPFLGLGVAVALAAFGLTSAAFRRSRRDWLAGLALGSLVPLAWLAQAHLVEATQPPPAGLTFVAPTAAILLAGAVATFGGAAVIGTLLGGALGAWAGGTWRTERFAARDDTLRHLSGAVLMGFGGALAGGCTIGQGVSGLSTLALPSILALVGIAAGGVLGVRALEAGGALALLRRTAARLAGPGGPS